VCVCVCVFTCVICKIEWCDRCLLITKRPKAPSHYRYLIWVLCYILYMGLNGVQFCDCSCSCVYCDVEFLKFVFSTLRSRRCFQFNWLFPFYLGGVWHIVMNKYPIKCLHIYNLQIIYINNIQKKNNCFAFCLYVVSVEILNNSKSSRAIGS